MYLIGTLWFPVVLTAVVFCSSGLPLWLLAVIIFAWMCFWAADESFEFGSNRRNYYIISPLLTIILLLVFLQLSSEVRVLGYIYDNPLRIIWQVLAYFGIGAAWSIFKYRSFLVKGKKSFSEPRGGDESYRTRFIDYYKFENNRDRIGSWILFWPWSVVVSFFRDLWWEIVNWIMDMLGVVYKRMWKNVFGDMLPKEK